MNSAATGIAIAALAALLFAVNAVSSGSTWSGLIADAVGAVAVALLFRAARRQPVAARRAWLYIASAIALWVLGDFVWDGYAVAGLARPDVSIADALYLGAYALLTAGLFQMARARTGEAWRDGIADGAIFAMAVAVVVWRFLVAPIAATTSSWLTSAVWSAYPLADALMLGGVAWLVFSPGRRDRSAAWLLVALCTTLTVDFLYSYLPTVSAFDTGHLDPAYPVIYLMYAAAALTATSEVAEPVHAMNRMHAARFVLLGAALGSAAIVIVSSDSTASTRWVYLGFALVLCALIAHRFALAIRSREAIQAQLEYRSTHDDLTGAVNRVLLLDRIEYAIARTRRRPGESVAILYIDLDQFKSVNDNYGHDIGDELLREMSVRARGVLRSSDTFGRSGGDEFVALCEGISPVDALRVAERLIAAIAEPFRINNLTLNTSASIGVAVGSGSSDSLDDLLRDADNAMYVAKRRGGNGFAVSDERLRGMFDARREMEEALLHATTTDELVLHLQPSVRAGSETIASFEALLRWQRAGDTLLQPGEFIAIAEETGAIIPIGAWVLEQACRRLASWALDGIAAPAISVNVSALQFRNGALLRAIKQALARTGADPGRLVLEITESVLVRENDQVIEQLEQARRLGIRVAIDDFGTGYSGLSYLHRLPVDIIKLDRSLVSQLALDPSATIVCRAIIDLAHALGIEIIAEGAETAADVERLVALQCDQIQGFVYARPLLAPQADIAARHGLRALQARVTEAPSQR